MTQTKFLTMLYAIPTVLFVLVVLVHQTAPIVATATHKAAVDVVQASRRVVKASQSAAETAVTTAAAQATTVVYGGAARIGEKRVVVTDQGRSMVYTYGDWLNEKDRAVRERVNSRAPEPKWLSYPWTHWEKI